MSELTPAQRIVARVSPEARMEIWRAVAANLEAHGPDGNAEAFLEAVAELPSWVQDEIWAEIRKEAIDG